MMNRIPFTAVELLRSRGVTVVIEPGAMARGTDFPRGIYGGMLHHWGSTAAATGAVQAGHTYPRSQGGLRTDERVNCNWFSDRDGTIHLISAGAATYSSCYGSRIVLEEVRTDTWPGGTARERGITDNSICGNRFFWNMEAEHPGDGSPMPDVQELAIATLVAVMCDLLGQTVLQVIGHLEWTGRKIDPRWEGPGNRTPAIRGEAQNILNGRIPAPIPAQETDMMKMPPTIRYGDGAWSKARSDAPDGDLSEDAVRAVRNGQALMTIRGFIDEKSEDSGSLPVDGKFGRGTEAAMKGFQITVGLAPDGACGPMTWTELIHAT